MNKHQQRKYFLEIRNQISDKKQYSAIICDLLEEFLRNKRVQCIAAYYPLGSEVDMRPLLYKWEQKGKRFALPISYPEGKMVFHEASVHRLQSGRYGIFQPPEHSTVISLEELECILVPGVAFDCSGMRIGYGKGYYDRILEHYTGYTVGVCYTEQIAQQVYYEPHDVPLKYLATEQGVLQIEKKGTYK